MAGILMIGFVLAAVLLVGFSVTPDRGEAAAFVVASVLMTIAFMSAYIVATEKDAYNQGVLDHAAGLVQVDSTWESRITIKEVGE